MLFLMKLYDYPNIKPQVLFNPIMNISPIEFFTDPVLRGPTIGCMLMCLAAALMGVVIFLRKQSLLGESLSHAAYPGVIIGTMSAGFLTLNESDEMSIAILILIGAFATSCVGLYVIHWLQKALKIRADSALCFVLASFFGIGITLASYVQFTHPVFYRQIQTYLYGQAATMSDVHILIYGILSLFVVTCLIMFYKELQAIIFSRAYAESLGIPVNLVNGLVFTLTALAIVIGIRSVGVVLMSAMLIAPAASARQFTNQFKIMLILAAFFGVVSGYLGNYLSVDLTYRLMQQYPSTRISIPTGPMIVLVASVICLISVLFAPERGLLLRIARIGRFRYQCMCENLLKAIWRYGPGNEITLKQMQSLQNISWIYLRIILMRLVKNGWLEKPTNKTYRLTLDGEKRAAKIIRLHRLWEVYLVDYLGVGAERVHRNAEEMEHIITPNIERELTLLLKDPQTDPHHQKIPPKEMLGT